MRYAACVPHLWQRNRKYIQNVCLKMQGKRSLWDSDAERRLILKQILRETVCDINCIKLAYNRNQCKVYVNMMKNLKVS
jgi:hypothetical protein